MQLRAVGPKYYRSLTRIWLGVVVTKSFHHRVAGVAIDHRQPTLFGVHPKFRRQRHVMYGEESIRADLCGGIFCRAKFDVILIQIAAR